MRRLTLQITQQNQWQVGAFANPATPTSFPLPHIVTGAPRQALAVAQGPGVVSAWASRRGSRKRIMRSGPLQCGAAMSEVAYQFRSGRHTDERSYQQTDKGLLWHEGVQSKILPYADIRKIRIFGSPNPTIDGVVLPDFKVCAISGRTGPTLILSSNHFVRFGVVEDRSSTFAPFVTALIQRVSVANPDAVFVGGMPVSVWSAWAVVSALLILALGLIVMVLVELVPKGEDLVTIELSVLMLVALLPCLPLILRMLVRGWPRRFFPRSV